ncbi:MAG: ABC transporter substrate-binding protein [Deltaproteobacteria bacterium]|nr:ABC transporter substrate-binding protein [Deltaproteobacteria bacterium]MBW2342977.1 ABC transporter substrate-binding protein [Deltaproteobacteria bacterium]
MKKKRSMVFIVSVFLSLFFLSNNNLLAADPYVIGYLTDITGHARANYAPESEGFRVYMDLVNAKGGINGHPVKVVIEDGKSDPSKSAAVAKKLIIEDKVLAICGLGFSRSQPPVNALAKKEGVAVVSGYTGIEAVQDTKPGSIGFATGYIMHPNFHPGAYASARFLQAIKPKGSTLAITGYATPGARVWTNLTEKWVKEMGYKVVYRDDIPPRSVDLSPWINKVAKLNSDSYISIVGTALVLPQLTGLEKMGYTKDMIFPDFTPEGDLLKGIKRLIGNGEWIIWGGRYATVYDKLPEMKRISEAMKKFGHQYPLSARTCHGWTMGRLLEQALMKAGWPCSRAGLIAALEKADLDTKGLTGGPIQFTPTDHYGPTWWRAYRWNASKKALVPAMDWFKIEAKTVSNK